jgi:hypothetical protein
LRVVVDTGSVGLRVFARDFPGGPGSGITLTGVRDSVTFVDGTVFTGQEARAKIKIGTWTTTRSIAFQWVQSASCDSANPNCPATLPGFYESGEGTGVMGIGLGPPGPDDPNGNPFLALPGNLGQSWSIHMNYGQATGRLELGVAEEKDPLATVHLDSLGNSGRDRFWDDARVMCWTVASTTQCVPTVFDSGSSVVFFQGAFKTIQTVTWENGFNVFADNNPVTLGVSTRSSPFWSFDSGAEPGVNAAGTLSGQNEVASTGVQLFYSLVITFSDRFGTISLSTVP